MMMIRVVYRNGETGLVDDGDLDRLIRDAQVLAFCRAEGWVNIGEDAVRTCQRPFTGPGDRWSDMALQER